MQTVSRSTLGLAAEYAVAAELCRRNVYAQLTLGNQKRTDLLAFSETGQLIRLEVKGKQGRSWPSCRGISGRRTFLIFFAGKAVDARPDFYVLTSSDWRRVVKKRISEFRASNPRKRIKVDPDNVPIFVDEIGKSGKPHKGIAVRVDYLIRYQEKWNKVLRSLGAA